AGIRVGVRRQHRHRCLLHKAVLLGSSGGDCSRSSPSVKPDQEAPDHVAEAGDRGPPWRTLVAMGGQSRIVPPAVLTWLGS
ncbi:hypothetical protein HaLaN_29766, partial [Haematococcus lacustris]